MKEKNPGKDNKSGEKIHPFIFNKKFESKKKDDG